MCKSAEDHWHGLVVHWKRGKLEKNIDKGGKLEKNIEKILQSTINIENGLISIEVSRLFSSPTDPRGPEQTLHKTASRN